MEFPAFLASAQGNALPSLLEKLAIQLGVSVNALTALGLGYAPTIPFESGKEFHDCWVIPERNRDGNVTGLGLRTWGGKKLTIPGSKRGLIFVPNPRRSAGAYQTGSHNFVRIANTGLLCPICGKPDWCLVSAENPVDPKAAICGRPIAEKGAVAHLEGAGWLHILKPEGDVRGEPVLPLSDRPVLIVEGMSDVAAAYDLGLVAVGRPSATSGISLVGELVAGLDVLIVGENDKGAGREGMELTRVSLEKITKSARCILPPGGIKDLRAWKQAGVTVEELLAAESIVAEKSITILENDAPLEIGRAWLDAAYKQEDLYTLRKLNSVWYAFNGQFYEELEKDILRKQLYNWLETKQYRKATRNGFSIEPYNPSRGKIDNIIDALGAFCAIKSITLPCWLEPDDRDPREFLIFPNGYLNAKVQNKSVELQEITPKLFAVSAFPYLYDPTATCPLWRRFLADIFADDRAKIVLLQEWFGYNLVPNNSFEKFMFFLGPPRAGKGTILEVLSAVLGHHQVIATSLRHLTNRFAMFPFVGKLAAVVGDMSGGMNYDAHEALTQLKSITGNDAVSVERKGIDLKDAFVKLHCRFSLASNLVPRFPDYARALESRILVLPFLNSYVGREDTTLKSKLSQEAPGILLWALEGLNRLQQRRQFTILPDSDSRLMQIRHEMTPLSEFIDTVCELGDYRESQNRLYQAWISWARQAGEQLYSRRWLLQSICTMFPTLSHIDSYVNGIRLKTGSKQEMGIYD